MKKHLSLYLYGIIIIFVGIFLLFSQYTQSTFTTIKSIVGIALTVGAVLAFITALSRQRKHVQFAYHEMHALAMFAYGVSVLLFCNTFETLTYLTTFLFIFYAFSELIFCNWLFNLRQKVIYKIVLTRLLLGLVIGVGTIVNMNFPEFTLRGFGALFIAVGINVLLYAPVMKSTEPVVLDSQI
jgi:uncharacterized membrane protein HdeD (DUF308 family)